jgi:hypothetical protein
MEMYIWIHEDPEKKRPPNPDRTDIDGIETESKEPEII